LIGREISSLEQEALAYIEAHADSEIISHSLSTRDLALEINRDQALLLDEEKVSLAALCHDIARHFPVEKMASELRSRGIDPAGFGFAAPILLHGPLSAEIAREEIGVTDEEVLDAIRWHTTGREKMSLLEKLIYVADKVEIGRDYPGVPELRALARKNLIEAFPAILAKVICWLVADLKHLDYNSIAAYNRALGELKSPVNRLGRQQ
jgi:predicted HD superfamily hydrolase involved in NAD metabolism